MSKIDVFSYGFGHGANLVFTGILSYVNSNRLPGFASICGV